MAKLLSILVFLLACSAGNAQLSDQQYQRIDSLFSGWNTSNKPGGTIGIIKGEKIVFIKGYGLSSLEYNMPNTEQTIFNVASIAKQFTAMGIVILEEKGMLSFDDDIKNHIPALSDLKEKVTIRHLLHHTSGLRGFPAILDFLGWRWFDYYSNEDLNELIKKPIELNFNPGEEYLYSNANYMLLVNIIESITGEKFKEWIKKSIFDEFDMDNTYVRDVHNSVVSNHATSYYYSNEYLRAIEYWGDIGSSNVHATTHDLLTWSRNFYLPQEGWKDRFETLLTLDSLSSGQLNRYGFGLFIDQNLDKKRLHHMGRVGGFLSFWSVYPKEEIGIVVLTNFSASNAPAYATEIAEILIDQEKWETEKSEIQTPLGHSLPDNVSQFEGSYWDGRRKLIRKIYLRNDTLRFFRPEYSWESPLLPYATHEYKILNVDRTVNVTLKGRDDPRILTIFIDNSNETLTKLDTINLTNSMLNKFTGKYYCPEIEVTYEITLNEGHLECHIPRLGKIEFEHIGENIFKGSYPILVAEFIEEDSDNKYMYLSNTKVRNLRFIKD